MAETESPRQQQCNGGDSDGGSGNQQREPTAATTAATRWHGVGAASLGYWAAIERQWRRQQWGGSGGDGRDSGRLRHIGPCLVTGS